MKIFRESQSLSFLESCVNFTKNVAKFACLSFREVGARGRPLGETRAGCTMNPPSLVSDEVCVRNGSDIGVFREREGVTQKRDLWDMPNLSGIFTVTVTTEAKDEKASKSAKHEEGYVDRGRLTTQSLQCPQRRQHHGSAGSPSTQRGHVRRHHGSASAASPPPAVSRDWHVSASHSRDTWGHPKAAPISVYTFTLFKCFLAPDLNPTPL